MEGISILFDGNNFSRLMQGLWITIYISFVSIIISVIAGLILGILMSMNNKIIYFLCKFALEAVRVMPIIVWLFLLYFGLPRLLNVHMDATLASIIVFSIWGAIEMMDIVRGATTSIPKHQLESAYSVGLTNLQSYAYVIIPLATRRLVPGAINLLSRMVKTTSIVVLIGVIEVVKIGQQIIELNVFTNNFAPFWVYGFIFFLYFIICYPISKLSKVLEERWK